MQTISRRVLLLSAFGLLYMAATGLKASETRDGVFIHVSHGADNPHRLLKALTMASVLSANHPVVVYFDIKAVEAVLKDSKDIQLPKFLSSKRLLSALTKQGVRMLVCLGSLQIAGKTEADLLPGIEVSGQADLFSFTSGRIISLDY
ncbi:MAG: DsrE family protein [Bryobacteraceae bacterium]